MARPKKKAHNLRSKLASQLKNSFESALTLGIGHLDGCYDSVYKSFSERLALYTTDCIVSLSKSLNLPITYTATALAYFQFYKSLPQSSWSEHAKAVYNKSNGKIGNELGSHVLAAACLLLAWKYKEDESSDPRCIKKLFELSSGIYRLILASTLDGSVKISASKWILDTEGSELVRLKNLITTCENNLLHSLNYMVGPIAMPFRLINGFCDRLISLAENIVTKQELELLEQKLKSIVSLVLLECCKTSMYIDFTGNELVVASVIKTLAILNIPNISHEKEDSKRLEDWNNLLGEFTNSCIKQENEDSPKVTCKRLSMALSQIRYFQQVPL